MKAYFVKYKHEFVGKVSLILIVYVDTNSSLINLFAGKFCAPWSYVYKMYIKDISISSRLYNYYFDNLIKAKKLETKNILIDEENCKDLVI